MKKIGRANKLIAIITCILFGSSSWAMDITQDTEPSVNLVENSKSLSEVYVTAKPLLDGEESEKYFDEDLPQKNILAVYLSVENITPDASFIIPAESIYISEIQTNNKINSPYDQEGAAAISLGGALLLSPLLIIIGAHKLKEASQIRVNFETNRFRSNTIDPGQTVSGYSYFNWTDFVSLNKATICFDLIDPIADRTIPYCQNIDLRRESHEERN